MSAKSNLAGQFPMLRVKTVSITFLVLVVVGHATVRLSASETADFHSKVKPVLTKYCIACHNDKDRKSDLSYEGLGEKDYLSEGSLLQDMHWVVTEHEMPPAKAKAKPSVAERAVLAKWIERQLLAIRNMHPDDPGIVAMPRLTSSSYDRAIVHLAGLDLAVGQDLLPRDGVAGEGFANVGAAQGMPPSQLESYLEAARTVVEHLRVDPIAGCNGRRARWGRLQNPPRQGSNCRSNGWLSTSRRSMVSLKGQIAVPDQCIGPGMAPGHPCSWRICTAHGATAIANNWA